MPRRRCSRFAKSFVRVDDYCFVGFRNGTFRPNMVGFRCLYTDGMECRIKCMAIEEHRNICVPETRQWAAVYAWPYSPCVDYILKWHKKWCQYGERKIKSEYLSLTIILIEISWHMTKKKNLTGELVTVVGIKAKRNPRSKVCRVWRYFLHSQVLAYCDLERPPARDSCQTHEKMRSQNV